MNLLPTLTETITISFVWVLLLRSLLRNETHDGRTALIVLVQIMNIALVVCAYLWSARFLNRVIAWGLVNVAFCLLISFENRGYSTEITVAVLISYATTLFLQLMASATVAVVFLAMNEAQSYVYVQLWKTTFHVLGGIITALLICRAKRTVVQFATRYAIGVLILSGSLFTLAYELIQGREAMTNREFNQFVTGVIAFCYAVAIFNCLNERKKQREIQKLLCEIKTLSAQIHKTKETIPAYHTRLRELKGMADSFEKEAIAQEIASITEEFAALSDSIKGRSRQEFLTHPLPSTGLSIVDAQLTNEQLEASRHKIDFECSVGAPLTTLIGRYPIPVPELQQIIGDLVSNAIKQTALSGTEEKQVQIFLGDTSDGYRIQVYDTAAPFSPDILSRIGERGVSTGGTGNGIPDIIEAVRPYRASLVIQEYAPGADDFTKSVSVVFDGAAQARIDGRSTRRSFGIGPAGRGGGSRYMREYAVVDSIRTSDPGGQYLTFGVCAPNGDRVDDVTTDFYKLARFVFLLNSSQASPIHLRDLIDDFLLS